MIVHLRDAASGHTVELRGRRGVLRVCVHARSAGEPVSLRLLLVADVLRRVVELTDVQTLVALEGLAPEDAKKLIDKAHRWAIQDPTVLNRGADPAATLGGAVTVDVVGPGAPSDLPGYRVAVGSLTAGDILNDEPAAVRLQLLSHRYADPLRLGADTSASETVSRWRTRMTEWSQSPSRPIPQHLREEALGYFANDLDTRSVLLFLASIEANEHIASGAKFETFAFVDRVLGLELARDIGR